MSRKIVIRSAAQEDIALAATWYERQQIGLGNLLLDELDVLLTRLKANPLQFAVVESEVRRGLLRRFPYGVYFIIDTSHIEVIAVLHLHRKPFTWKSRLCVAILS